MQQVLVQRCALVLICQKILLQQVHYADAATAVVLALQNPSKVSILKKIQDVFQLLTPEIQLIFG